MPSYELLSLEQFSYSSWHDRLKAFTHSSVVIELPQDFVLFLHEDGLVVHDESTAMPQRCKPGDIIVDGVDYDPDDTYSNSSSSTQQSDGSDTLEDDGSDPAASCEQQPWCQRFPELHAQLQAAIHQLGGAVAPKLNWSSPTDALWISSYNSLKCTDADQVILLLKSSDRIMHDLEQLAQLQQQQHSEQLSSAAAQQQVACDAAEGPVAAAAAQTEQQQLMMMMMPQLVLRQWHDLPPDREYRCFVHQHKPVAISQRDVSQCFPQLMAPGEVHRIREQILEFHARNIKNSFPSPSYAMDVYVPSSGPVVVLDFNPIMNSTSPLLFSWTELPYHQMHSHLSNTQDSNQQQEQQEQHNHLQQNMMVEVLTEPGVELRVAKDVGVFQPGMRVATGMPVDMLGLPQAFEQVLQAMQHQQQRETSTSTA